MFAVYMFGMVLERRWRSKRFLTYYLVTGIGAGLIQMLVYYLRINSLLGSGELPFDALAVVHGQGHDLLMNGMNFTGKLGELNVLYNGVTIGASGSVFGILLAFGMLYPNAELMLMFIPIPIKAKYFVVGYGAIELFLGFANFGWDNIAHFAHLGGMLFGFFMMLYWKRKDKKNVRFF